MVSNLCCPVCCSLLTACLAFGQPHASSRFVYGQVIDAITHEPLAHVNIVTSDLRHTTISNGHGGYHLSLDPGDWTIRFSLVGYKPLQKKVTAPLADSVACDASLVPTDVMLDEVTVEAEKAPLSTVHGLGGISLSPRQVESLSGVFGDVYKTIQAMPGVTANDEMSSQISVRGGGTDENLMLVNGVRMLEPFHLKESPNTSLSVVSMDIVKRILFIPGGFTARYGDRLSSVLDLEYREGSNERLAGQVDASLTNAGLIIEGPFSSRASGLVCGRSTYSNYINNYLTDGDKRHPSFYDLQGIVGGDIAEGHHVALHFLRSSDETSGLTEGKYSSTLIGIGSTNHISEKSTLTASLSTYSQTEDLAQGLSVQSLTPAKGVATNSAIVLQEGKAQVEAQISDPYSVIAGVDILRSRYRVAQVDHFSLPTGDSASGANLDANVTLLSIYGENLVQVTPHLLFNAGLRADHFTLTHELQVSPRFLAAFRFGEGPTIKAAWGIYYQTPNYHQLLAAEQAHLAPQQMQRAIHYIVGVEQPLRAGVAVKLDLYHKDLEHLISYIRLRNGELIYSPRNDAIGRIDGAEFEMTVTDPRVMAWINVTLMVAKELNLIDGQGWRYRPTDQRKTVTTIFEIRIAEGWALNLRAYYGSGFAYATDLPGVDDTRGHYPDYKRADARLSHSWMIGPVATLAYLEVMNVFGFKNVYSFTGETVDSRTPDFNLLLPRVVNLGLKVRF